MPPPIDEAVDGINAAPVISNTFPGPADLPKNISLQCTRYNFSARVSDPNEDRLFTRIFYDYLTDPRRFEAPVTEVRPGDAVAIQVNPLLFDSSLAVNTLELLVADRPFDAIATDGRTLNTEEGQSTSFVWAIQLIAEDDPECR